MRKFNVVVPDNRAIVVEATNRWAAVKRAREDLKLTNLSLTLVYSIAKVNVLDPLPGGGRKSKTPTNTLVRIMRRILNG